MSQRTLKETEPLEQKPPVIEPANNHKGFGISRLLGRWLPGAVGDPATVR